MEVKWANVAAFGLGIFGLWLALKMHREMAVFLSSMSAIGPGHDPDDQVRGLIAVGVILVSLLGLIKIVLQNKRDE